MNLRILRVIGGGLICLGFSLITPRSVRSIEAFIGAFVLLVGIEILEYVRAEHKNGPDPLA